MLLPRVLALAGPRAARACVGSMIVALCATTTRVVARRVFAFGLCQPVGAGVTGGDEGEDDDEASPHAAGPVSSRGAAGATSRAAAAAAAAGVEGAAGEDRVTVSEV